MRTPLATNIHKMPITNLDREGSKFAKMIQYNPPRSGLMLPALADETYLRKLGLWKDDKQKGFPN